MDGKNITPPEAMREADEEFPGHTIYDYAVTSSRSVYE